MICTAYGPPDVLRLTDVEKPVPKRNEILITIRATTVTAADYRIRGLNVPDGFGVLMRIALGFRKPRRNILGVNFSGVIESTGSGVKHFKVGERVVGVCGMKFGAYAEYICIAENDVLVKMPASMSFEEAAAFPFGALTALYFLRDKAGVKKGDRVLIYGASGSVGTAAVQLAKYFGADVSAVCSAGNAGLVRSLGAENVIDYTAEDFSKKGVQYDVIFDTVGKSSFSDSIAALTDRGCYLLAVAGIPLQLKSVLLSATGKKKIIAGVSGEKKEDLDFLVKLYEEGALIPVIDRQYAFEDLPAAHAYAEQGHKKGNVVITV